MSALLYEVKDGIAWIRFNKPEILNAFDADECRHFVKTLKEAAEDKAVKAIILSSVGPAFSAGDDLKAALEEYPRIQSGEIHPILDIVEDITENLQEIPRIIRRAPKVVIAAVRGYAVGAGFEISIDSDMIVAAKDAVFGFPESNAGMTITGGATKLLPMIVGGLGFLAAFIVCCVHSMGRWKVRKDVILYVIEGGYLLYTGALMYMHLGGVDGVKGMMTLLRLSLCSFADTLSSS